MKKLILLLSIVPLFLSCSSDEESTPASAISRNSNIEILLTEKGYSIPFNSSGIIRSGLEIEWYNASTHEIRFYQPESEYPIIHLGCTFYFMFNGTQMSVPFLNEAANTYLEGVVLFSPLWDWYDGRFKQGHYYLVDRVPPSPSNIEEMNENMQERVPEWKKFLEALAAEGKLI